MNRLWVISDSKKVVGKQKVRLCQKVCKNNLIKKWKRTFTKDRYTKVNIYYILLCVAFKSQHTVFALLVQSVVYEL